MRKELELIERIENYLLNKMSSQEKEAFESEMNSNPKLKEKVHLQESLTQRVNQLSLKKSAKNAHSAWKVRKRSRFILLFLGVCVIGLGTYFLWPNGEKENAENDFLLEEFVSENDVKPNNFVINNKRDTILFGEQGTAIYIDSNSFQNSFGESIEGEIEIELKEYYQMEDILLHNLSTVTEDSLLETAGMIYLSAQQEGEELELKYDKEVNIHFPKNGNEMEMEFFSGGKNSQDQIIWRKESTFKGGEKDTLTPFIIKYKDLDSDYMLLEDGTNIWNWLDEEIELKEEERKYIRFRDVNVKFMVTKNGDVKNVHLDYEEQSKKCKRFVKLIKRIKKIQPFRRNGQLIDMESWVNFAVKYFPPSYATNKNYLDEIENTYPEFEQQSINNLGQAELHYYIFNSAKLGWMNCDRFVDDPSPKVDMVLTVPQPENVMVKFVYKDFKSVVPAKFIDKTHHFKGIPSNKDITLLMIRSEKKGVKISISEMKTKSGNIQYEPFKEITMGELKKELAKLN